jgi:hypothetical protein
VPPQPKSIDPVQVAKLARLGCTEAEIADFFGVSQQTISRRFRVECSRARASLKMSIRRAQYRRAVKDRSDTMLIHLGKCYLAQGGESDGMSGPEVLSKILADHAARAGTNGDGKGKVSEHELP